MAPSRLLRHAAAVWAACTLASLVDAPTAPAAEWRVEGLLGAPWNASLPLVIRQDGERALRIRPKWTTRALRFPLYYAVAIERERWSLSLVHHKLHLLDPPPEIEEFAISHGYNLVLLGRRGEGPWSPRLSAGAVVAHPENRVRGRPGPQGYRLAGVALEAAARRTLRRGRWRLVAEIAASAAWARVPVAGGDADVPNLALHLRLGPSLSNTPLKRL